MLAMRAARATDKQPGEARMKVRDVRLTDGRVDAYGNCNRDVEGLGQPTHWDVEGRIRALNERTAHAAQLVPKNERRAARIVKVESIQGNHIDARRVLGGQLLALPSLALPI